jgi:K+-transporting ATPase ATPase A chain
MTLNGWIQIAVFMAIIIALTRPLGGFLMRVAQGERQFLTPVLGWLERGFYRVGGIDPTKEQSWLTYAVAMLVFKGLGFVLLYAVLRLQTLLPLNPAGQSAITPDLAFNTAVSFLTNTNWQSYSGETTMSFFSQMFGLTVQNFLSAAAGIAVALAVIRGFARRSAATIGNFWADLTRITIYVLLPISIVGALFCVWQGIPQTFTGTVEATTLEGAKQIIALGPVAS